MRIWMINHYACSSAQVGGNRHVSLAGELVRRGHSVNLFASSFNHSTRTSCTANRRGRVWWEEFSGVEIGWLRTPPYFDNSFGRVRNELVFAWRLLQLPRYCNTRPDIIYAATPSLFAALASLVVARRLGLPFVLEVRDIWPQTIIDMGMSRFHPFAMLAAAIEGYLYRHADAITTLMPNAAPHLVAHGAAHERIYWIPNGVNFELVVSIRPAEQKKVLDVMYAGAYAGGNDPSALLDAAAELKRRGGATVRFRFVGMGVGEAAMMAKAKALGLDNVRFEPSVPKSMVYTLLSEADILVAPVKYLPVHRFGVSGNKVLDYMAVARPVIHAVRAPNHDVREAGCGIECAPHPEALAEAITTLAAMSPQQRWELGLRGRRYVEQNYDFARIAVKLEEALKSALDGRKTLRVPSASVEPCPDSQAVE